MGKIADAYRKETGYTGHIGCSMTAEQWNDYCKFASKWRNSQPEHVAELKERKEQIRQEKLKIQSDPLWKKKKFVSKYLKYTTDIENVENFNTAESENFKDWDIHHRKEDEGLKMSELIASGLYYDRPADELIFLRHSEHIRMHTCKNIELAYKRALKKIERAQNAIKSAEKTIAYCKKFLEKNA